MELMVIMSMNDYNKILSDAKKQIEEQKDIELMLYWAHRFMEDNTEIMSEYLKTVKERGFKVERKGTKMYVERLPLI